MITLDVLSVNGDTGLADATYPVYEVNVLYGFEDPDSGSQTYLEYINEADQSVLLLVNDTVANVVTALTGGNIDQHLGVTFKEKDGRAFAHTGLINLQNIVYMYDQSSDAYLWFYSPTWQAPKEIVTDDTSSTIAAGGGAYVEFESHVALKKNDISIKAVTVYFNELYIRKRAEGYGYQDSRQATAAALLKFETTTGAGGSGYSVNDVLTAVGGTGTAATATVTHLAPVDAQDETDYDGAGDNGSFTAGTGYAGSDTITLSDGTVITVDAVSGGAVTEFTVDSSASTGTTSDLDTLTQSSTSGGGSGFDLTLGLNNQQVHTVTLTTAGSYSVIPGVSGIATTVAPAGGTGATLATDYEVASISVSDGGAGYRSATATVTGGGGTGATATVAVGSGIVTGLTVTAAGNNFTSIPTVTISAPNVGDAIFVSHPGGSPQVWTY